MTWQLAVFLLIEFVLANLPWLSRSLFFIKPLPSKHPMNWRFVQAVVYLVIAWLFSLVVEDFLMGGIYPQDWEFYATFVCLFLVFGFPGFIYRLYKSL